MNMLDKIISKKYNTRLWSSIVITVFISALLTLWGIYGMGEYGIALFIITPFFMGVCSSVLYGYKRTISMTDSFKIGFGTLTIFGLFLVILPIEGLICIIMSAPIAIMLTLIGCFVGYAITMKNVKNTPTLLLVIIAMIPTISFIEKDIEPDLTSVVTSIEIHADANTVWKNVVEFPPLKEPTEFIFQTGIAYPINAKISGTGLGAVRYCNFTTGSFIEPITVWDEPKLLKFSVEEQPAPMKEISFWDIDAPHLHDYFVSKKGQFKLTTLPNGNTLLEGTTWYYHNIKPAIYWRIWSDMIIHKIHQRVLTHIKANAENEMLEVK